MHSPPTTSHRCKDRIAVLVGHSREIAARRGLRRSLAIVPLLLALAGSHLAQAKPPAPTRTPSGPGETVLRGEVVETGCFVIGGRRGAQHLNCALACAHAGEPLGILDDQTKLLFVAIPDLTGAGEPNPLLAHVAQRVEVRGVTVERGGINGIMIRKVHSLAPPAKR